MPGRWLLDIGARFDAANPGVVILRKDDSSAVKFQNYLFLEELGTTPGELLGPDWLHNFSLGVLPWFNGWVFWQLALADVWCILRQGGDLVAASLHKMKGELTAWYRLESSRGNQWTRVQDIKLGMVGNREKRYLQLYAAESNAFLDFTGVLLQRYGVALGEVRLAAAQRCQASLAELHQLYRKHPLRMPLRGITHQKKIAEMINKDSELLIQKKTEKIKKNRTMDPNQFGGSNLQHNWGVDA